MSQQQRRSKVSTGDDILAQLDAARQLFARSGVVLSDGAPGFSEPATAALSAEEWAAPTPVLKLVAESHAELEAYRSAKTDELHAMLARLQLSPEHRGEIESAIQSLGGASNKTAIDTLARNISNQIVDASHRTTTERSLNDQELREQRIGQLLATIGEIDKKISGKLGELEACGVEFSERDKQRMAELQAWAEANPNDKKSPQYQEYIALQRKMANEAERQANDPDSHVTDRDKARTKAQEIRDDDKERARMQKELEEAQKEYDSKGQYKEASTAARSMFAEPSDSEDKLMVSKHDPSEIGTLSAPQARGKVPSDSGRNV